MPARPRESPRKPGKRPGRTVAPDRTEPRPESPLSRSGQYAAKALTAAPDNLPDTDPQPSLVGPEVESLDRARSGQFLPGYDPRRTAPFRSGFDPRRGPGRPFRPGFDPRRKTNPGRPFRRGFDERRNTVDNWIPRKRREEARPNAHGRDQHAARTQSAAQTAAPVRCPRCGLADMRPASLAGGAESPDLLGCPTCAYAMPRTP